MYRLYISGTLALVIVCSASRSYAVIMSQYDFTGSSLASSDTDLLTSSSDLMGPLPLGINAGAGTPPPTLELTFGDVADSLSNALAADDYYSFTVSRTLDVFSFDSLDFDWFKTAGAGANVQATLFWSDGGFSLGNQIDSVTLAGTGESGSFLARSIDLSVLPLSVSPSVEFRLYLDDAGASNQANLFRLDNILLSGDTSLVPEPSSMCLTGLGVLALARSLRRRRRQRCS